MTDALFAPLSPQEEIALRRVANGSENPDARIVARLCRKALLHRVSGVLQLTPLGRQRYEAMAKAPLLARRRSIHAVTNYVEGLIQKAQARNAHLIVVGNGSRKDEPMPIEANVAVEVDEAIPENRIELTTTRPPSALRRSHVEGQACDNAIRLGRTRLSMIEHRLNQIRLRDASRQCLAESKALLEQSRHCMPAWMGVYAR